MRNFTVIDCEQRTPEWFAARAKCLLTASRSKDMMAKGKAGRKNVVADAVATKLTGLPADESGYQSAAMLRGIELEPQAFAAYEALTGEMASRVGFLMHNVLPIGSSPDGVIGDFVGILELKVPLAATHLSYLKGGKLPAEYLPQVQHHLLVSGAEYCDFMSYGPMFPESLQTFLVRVRREDAGLAEYEKEVRAFLAEVEQEIAALVTITNPIQQLKDIVNAI